jgi:TolA-binding protein
VEVSVSRGVVEVRSARRPGVVARVAAGQRWIETDIDEAPTAAAATAAPTSVSPGRDDAPGEPPKHESAPAASAPAAPGARELFEKAAESRRAGDAAAAARAYEDLLRLHPSDARAGLAAFELGRLRMDRLGDRAGAIAALERAVALQVGSTFREDALARLVSAYAAQGNFKACERARDRYLASYPGGVHAGAVTTRCGSPSE